MAIKSKRVEKKSNKRTWTILGAITGITLLVGVLFVVSHIASPYRKEQQMMTKYLEDKYHRSVKVDNLKRVSTSLGVSGRVVGVAVFLNSSDDSFEVIKDDSGRLFDRYLENKLGRELGQKLSKGILSATGSSRYKIKIFIPENHQRGNISAITLDNALDKPREKGIVVDIDIISSDAYNEARDKEKVKDLFNLLENNKAKNISITFTAKYNEEFDYTCDIDSRFAKNVENCFVKVRRVK